MQRMSERRQILREMKEVFEELNKIPHETRKYWGSFGQWVEYNFMIEEIDKQIKRLDQNLQCVKNKKNMGVK